MSISNVQFPIASLPTDSTENSPYTSPNRHGPEGYTLPPGGISPKVARQKEETAVQIQKCVDRAGEEKAVGAAISIQSHYRKHVAEVTTSSKRTVNWCVHKNALIIQCAWRSAVARSARQQKRAELNAELERKALRRDERRITALVEHVYWRGIPCVEAACKIQRWYRAITQAATGGEPVHVQYLMYDIVQQAQTAGGRNRILAADERDLIADLTNETLQGGRRKPKHFFNEDDGVGDVVASPVTAAAISAAGDAVAAGTEVRQLQY